MLGVVRCDIENHSIGKVIVSLYCVHPIFYLAKVIRERMLCVWPVLDVEVEFLQK